MGWGTDPPYQPAQPTPAPAPSGGGLTFQPRSTGPGVQGSVNPPNSVPPGQTYRDPQTGLMGVNKWQKGTGYYFDPFPGQKPPTPDVQPYVPGQDVSPETREYQAKKLYDTRMDVLKKDLETRSAKAIEYGQRLPHLEYMKALLNQGADTSQPEWWATTKQYMQGLGVALGDPGSTDLTTAYQRTLKNMIPSMRQIGSGASSDRDMALFAGALPDFGTSKDANLLTINGMMQIARYTQRLYNARQDWVFTNRKPDWTEKDWQDYIEKDPDLRSPFRRLTTESNLRKEFDPQGKLPKAQVDAMIKQRWDEEVSKMAPGEIYYVPDAKSGPMKGWRQRPEEY